MDNGSIIDISREALFVLLKVSLPVLVVTLVVGLIISLFQALTQIQESTISFVPKIIAVSVSLILFMPYMLSTLKMFFERINDQIIGLN